jgi:uncharacterized repeat protein (TIGR02543 family)
MAGYTFTAYGYMGYPREQHVAEYDPDTPIETIFNQLTIPVSTQEGMIFTHWGLTIDGDWLDGLTVGEVSDRDGTTDVQLYGVFDYDNDSIQVTLDGNGGHWEPTSVTTRVLTAQRGASLGEISQQLAGNPVRTGYTFMGWMVNDEMASWDIANLGNLALTAVWEEDASDVVIHSEWGNITVPGGTKVNEVDWDLINVNIPDQSTTLDTLVGAYGPLHGTVIHGFDFSGSNMPFRIKDFDDWAIDSQVTDGKTIGSFGTTTVPFDKYELEYSIAGSVMVGSVSTGVAVVFAPFSSSDFDTPGLYAGGLKIWDAGLDIWTSQDTDTYTFDADTKILTFKADFTTSTIVDLGSVYDPDIRVIIDRRIGDLHIEDEMPLYEDITINPTIVADIAWSKVRFVNSTNGFVTEVVKADGSELSVFWEDVNPNDYYVNGMDMIGFWSENGTYKVSMSDQIYMNHTVTSKYVESIPGVLETEITADGNGGTFYTDTLMQTDVIRMGFNTGSTYGQIQGFIPPVKNGQMKPIYWYIGDHEPTINHEIDSSITIKPLWSIEGTQELYRLPREFYLIDADSMDWGWNEMKKFPLSDRNQIFVVDPKGLGTEFETGSDAMTVNGWTSSDRQITPDDITFTAYFHDYDNYRKLGRWIQGRKLAIAALNDTGIPTYWHVELTSLPKTEIEYFSNGRLMTSDITFKKLSPAFDLEFIGIGTNGILNNKDDQNRKRAYIRIHTTSVMRDLTNFTVIAKEVNGEEHYSDSLQTSIPEGTFMRYSTIPFREEWTKLTNWGDKEGESMYTAINLVGSDPIILGIGDWVISTNSDGYLKISDLSPNTIASYKNQTINMVGGSSGNFVGIAYKEKEI